MALAARAFVDGVEHAVEYRRLPLLRPMVRWPQAVKAWMRDAVQPPGSAAAHGPSADDSVSGFDAARFNTRQSTLSRRIMRMVDACRIAEKRRANYLRIHEQLSNTPGGVPLYRDLPADVVPYAYPFLVERPDRVFVPLKMAGVPILRFGESLWQGVDEDVCPVSVDLSRRVFLFPCHQELKEQELEWMLASVREIMKENRN
jgi:hypothetical protein